jgi:feruloyl-CoA synthase
MALGAMYAGVLYAPIAPAYSLAAKDHTTLRYLWKQFQPGLVFAAEGPAFERAIDAVATGAEEIVTNESFPDLLATRPTGAVDDAHAKVTPDTIAKILFTSGSTGHPKGVINTQRMLCSNQEMLQSIMQFLTEEPPVLCDWLPWNHTFGGNHNFGIALYNGGTLYIDEGKPAGKAFAATVRNLRDIATTAYFNVPKGFEMLVPYLKEDAAFRDHFFSRVKILFYAAAGLNQRVWDDLKQLAVDSCGEEILMVTGLGATESSPFALSTGTEGAAAGRVGLPVPGVELKLVPTDHKLEARLRGPNITPGFWRDDELTRAAYDEEGFYKLGDAVVFVDPEDPLKGFLFDGRINEDFKLSTGTWVSVGPLRMKFLTHFRGLAQEVVVAGRDRDFVAALVFPVPGADPARFQVSLEEFAALSTGSSTCIERILLLDEAPSADAMEITDKGSINQKAVLTNRAILVEELYRGSPRVIEIRGGKP